MENKRTVQAFLNFDSLDLDFLVIRFTRSIILVPEVFFFFGSFGGLGEVFLWSFGGIAERGRKEICSFPRALLTVLENMERKRSRKPLVTRISRL